MKKMKFFTYLTMGIILINTQILAQNLLGDGDFSATTIVPDLVGIPPPGEWCKFIDAGATADISVLSEVCSINVSSTGAENWMVQLIQGGFILEEGHAYRLSFDVKAESETWFGLFLGENEGYWFNLLGYERYWQFAGTDWQTITLDFVASCVFPYHKLSFECGSLDNNTLYIDNVFLEDMGISAPSIGIIGTSVGGWDTDYDMETSDGINYTLSDFYLEAGEVKFRQDNLWCKNWGGFDFPMGYGFQDGPNIFICYSGYYDINFNIETGEYLFVAKMYICPYDVYTESEPDACGATVFYPEIIPAGFCGGEGLTVEQIEGLPSGAFFPTGETLNTFLITDEAGNSVTCGFTVYIYEFDPPVISGLPESIDPIWPPNHKMVNVNINYTSSDCTPTNCFLTVSSNEQTEGTEADWEIVDEHNVRLRAERSGNGNGREYYITINCYDEFWNFSSQEITVSVPHDNRNSVAKNKNKSAIIGELNENETFTTNVWPNPSANTFNLEVRSSSNESISISIFDISGRQISTLETSNKEFFRFGEELNQGMYHIIVKQGNNLNNIKVIKQ